MLEEITEKCTDLLMQHSSIASQTFEPEYYKDPLTAYQRFAFIKSILDSTEFYDSIHKIISSPVTQWKEIETMKDIRGIKKLNNSSLRQMLTKNNRSNLPENHPLRSIISTLPLKIVSDSKIQSVDTPENRFIKHALNSFLIFIKDFRVKLKDGSRLKTEVILLEEKLEQYLGHSIFKEVSRPTILPLNSPILQRKEGYREILRIWLMFDLAAKLVWHGGDDVYSGGKRNVATLYEYWLFFKLLELIKDIFKIEPQSIQNLITKTDDGLGFQLKQGQYFPIKGICDIGTRKLEIEFSYNKTFCGEKEYPKSGSWTKNMRPDYTLSIWPFGIDAESAEKQELITHLHFDSKYKVEKLVEILGSEEDFKNEKEEQKKGTYKRVDLLKMHAYKDAIRRTSGSYILYPGNEKPYTKQGFHELIPGLGAFAIRPSKVNNGTEELKKFLNKVVIHFMNRISQREKMSFRTYDTYKKTGSQELLESLPEAFGENRDLMPDDTFILVGYYEEDKWDWIKGKGLYNARTESRRGSLRLGPGEAGAKFLLLHTRNETITNKLLRITETGPRIFSKQTLINKGYPDVPSGNFYLVYKVEMVKDKEFLDKHGIFSKLDGYNKGRGSGLPFSTTLTELMKVIVKE